MTTRDDILTAALKLDADDRERLAMELVASLRDGEAEDAVPDWQRKIIERRLAEIESGEAELIPMDDALEGIMRELDKVRTRKVG